MTKENHSEIVTPTKTAEVEEANLVRKRDLQARREQLAKIRREPDLRTRTINQ